MHILIIDDHQMFRCGLSTALQKLTESTTISEADCIAEAKTKIEAAHRDIDLTLLDQSLPDGEGIEFLDYLQQRYPLLPVAILSAEESVQLMKQSLRAGAVGFISKNTDTAVVLGAIQLMLSGGTYIPPKMMLSYSSDESNTTADETTSPTANSSIQQTPLSRPDRMHLTSRQQEVMKLIIQGLSNKEIAWQLNISEGTVKAHTTAILKARGFYSRKQLIASGR